MNNCIFPDNFETKIRLNRHQVVCKNATYFHAVFDICMNRITADDLGTAVFTNILIKIFSERSFVFKRQNLRLNIMKKIQFHFLKTLYEAWRGDYARFRFKYLTTKHFKRGEDLGSLETKVFFNFSALHFPQNNREKRA